MTLPHPSLTPTVFPDAEPGVYRSGARVGGRWVYFALGAGGVLLDARRPRGAESDAEVVSGLRELYRAVTRAPLRLIGPSGEVDRPRPASFGPPPRPLGQVLVR